VTETREDKHHNS